MEMTPEVLKFTLMSKLEVIFKQYFIALLLSLVLAFAADYYLKSWVVDVLVGVIVSFSVGVALGVKLFVPFSESHAQPLEAEKSP